MRDPEPPHPPPGRVIWLTGLPATGKTTIAARLIERLGARGAVTLWLDSDDLRPVLSPGATYDEADRDRFYGALGHLAVLGARGGAQVVVSATAPARRYRDAVRERAARFVEVYVSCRPETARARDPKGLYAKAAARTITRLPGVGAPYEAPLHPELTIDTSEISVADATEIVLRWLDHQDQYRAGALAFVFDEHEAIEQDLGWLERYAGQDNSDAALRDRDFVAWVDRLVDRVQRHISHEERSHFYTTLPMEQPRFAARIEHLRLDHAPLLGALEQARREIKADPTSAALRRLDDAIRALRKHEKAENAVLLEASDLDLGGGD